MGAVFLQKKVENLAAVDLDLTPDQAVKIFISRYTQRLGLLQGRSGYDLGCAAG
jgi:hypothetical protein